MPRTPWSIRLGHYVERGRATFEAIHGQGALHVARASAKAGVKRLVHISGIGADAGSPSAYVRARAVGERLVTEAFSEATILRPSVIFGPEDAFFNQLAALARVMPILPLFGTGAVKLQPVYVGDVAEAVARALASEAARGQTYELGGPRTYTYKALLQLLLWQLGLRRLLLPIPYFAWEVLAAVMATLPKRPISRDQVVLMRRDNVVGPKALSFTELGLTPRAVEDILPSMYAPGSTARPGEFGVRRSASLSPGWQPVTPRTSLSWPPRAPRIEDPFPAWRSRLAAGRPALLLHEGAWRRGRRRCGSREAPYEGRALCDPAPAHGRGHRDLR